MNKQEKWNKRFLELAKLVSTWSKDPSTKVGAVITDPKNRVVSLGYNGYPQGIKDEGLENREEKYAKVLHGEVNAILFSNKDLTNCTIYVYPLLPCSSCMSLIIQSGITKVVSQNDDKTGELLTRWEKSNQIGIQMAKEANVQILVYGE
jgi:dCMP deaminase